MTLQTFHALFMLEVKCLIGAWRFWIALVPIVIVALSLVDYNASQFVPQFGSRSLLFALGLLAIGVAGAVAGGGARIGAFAVSRPASPRLVLGARLTALVATATLVSIGFLLVTTTVDGAFDSVRRSSKWSEIGLRAATDDGVQFENPESEGCFRAAEEEFPGGAMACGGLTEGVARTAAGAKPLIRLSDTECLERWRGSTPACEGAFGPFDSTLVGGAVVATVEIDQVLACYQGDPDEPERCRALADMLNESGAFYAYYPRGKFAGECIDLLVWLRSKPTACPSPHIEATAESLAGAWFIGLMLLGVLLVAVCLPVVAEPRSRARGWVAAALGVTFLWLLIPQRMLPFPLSPSMAIATPFALTAVSVGIGLVHAGRAEFTTVPGATSTWRRFGWSFGFWVLAALSLVAVAGFFIALMMFA